MELKKKKQLAARALNVGIGRIIFNKNNLNEIKEAITKQDIKDLFSQGAIRINQVKGRKKVQKRGRRRAGSIRMKIINRKKEYANRVRKLRDNLSQLKKQNLVTREQFAILRKEIKSGKIQNKAQINENINLSEKK